MHTAAIGTSVTRPLKGSSLAVPVTAIMMNTPDSTSESGMVHQIAPGTRLSTPNGTSTANTCTKRRVKYSYWRGVGVFLIRSMTPCAVLSAASCGSSEIGSN